jgi:hypothetical protein
VSWARDILIELRAGGYDVLPWPPASQLEDCDSGYAVVVGNQDIDIGWFDNQQGGIDCEGPRPLGCDSTETFDNDDCGGM